MSSDDELLHRAITNHPNHWNSKTKSISSALFKDSKGVSVDINSGEKSTEIKEYFIYNLSNVVGEVRILTNTCKEKMCHIKPDPIENNSRHTLILSSKTKIALTKSQAKYLSTHYKNIITYE